MLVEVEIFWGRMPWHGVVSSDACPAIAPSAARGWPVTG